MQPPEAAPRQRGRRLLSFLLALLAGASLVISISRVQRLLELGQGDEELGGGNATEPVAPAQEERAPARGPSIYEAMLPPQPTRYRLRAGAGDGGRLGELTLQMEGTDESTVPQRWQLSLRQRWKDVAQWQPLARVSLAHTGWQGALRWSRSLLPKSRALPQETLDGAGFDLRLETQLEQAWPSPAPAPPPALDAAIGLASPPQDATDAPPVVIQQAVEVVLGQGGQARLLNASFPLGLLVGANLRLQEGQGLQQQGGDGNMGPVKFYVRFAGPTPLLRGWLCEASVENERTGLLRGIVSAPAWGRRIRRFWSAEQFKTHVAVPVPGAGGAAAVPSTRLRASSEGGLVACSLEGGSGAVVGGSFEANQNGFRAQLSLLGSAQSDGDGQSFGRPRYTITREKAWQGRGIMAHELKWNFDNGQGVWVTVLQSPEGKPRVNAGLEIR